MSVRPPASIWVSLGFLATMSVVQLIIGLTAKPVILIGVGLNLILMYGLYSGHRWAYVMTLVLVFGGFCVTLLRDPATAAGSLLVNATVVVPMLLAHNYFWGKPSEPDVLHCPDCGYSLVGIAQPRCPECGREFAV